MVLYLLLAFVFEVIVSPSLFFSLVHFKSIICCDLYFILLFDVKPFTCWYLSLFLLLYHLLGYYFNLYATYSLSLLATLLFLLLLLRLYCYLFSSVLVLFYLIYFSPFWKLKSYCFPNVSIDFVVTSSMIEFFVLLYSHSHLYNRIFLLSHILNLALRAETSPPFSL